MPPPPARTSRSSIARKGLLACASSGEPPRRLAGPSSARSGWRGRPSFRPPTPRAGGSWRRRRRPRNRLPEARAAWEHAPAPIRTTRSRFWPPARSRSGRGISLSRASLAARCRSPGHRPGPGAGACGHRLRARGPPAGRGARGRGWRRRTASPVPAWHGAGAARALGPGRLRSRRGEAFERRPLRERPGEPVLCAGTGRAAGRGGARGAPRPGGEPPGPLAALCARGRLRARRAARRRPLRDAGGAGRKGGPRRSAQLPRLPPMPSAASGSRRRSGSWSAPSRSTPTTATTSTGFGWVLYRRGEVERAVKTLERAVERVGPEPTVLDHLGDAYRAAARPEEAAGAYRRALEAFDRGTEARSIAVQPRLRGAQAARAGAWRAVGHHHPPLRGSPGSPRRLL